MEQTVVYADGGCSPNPGPDGWGVVIATSEGILDLCGGVSDSTNNRMVRLGIRSRLDAARVPTRSTMLATRPETFGMIALWPVTALP